MKNHKLVSAHRVPSLLGFVVIVAAAAGLAGCESNDEVAQKFARECDGVLTATIEFSQWGRTVALTCQLKQGALTK